MHKRILLNITLLLQPPLCVITTLSMNCSQVWMYLEDCGKKRTMLESVVIKLTHANALVLSSQPFFISFFRKMNVIFNA